jgi:hypothetical protein
MQDIDQLFYRLSLWTQQNKPRVIYKTDKKNKIIKFKKLTYNNNYNNNIIKINNLDGRGNQNPFNEDRISSTKKTKGIIT